MDIEDSQRQVTKIEMLKVVLYLVRRERATRKKLARRGQKTRKKGKWLVICCCPFVAQCTHRVFEALPPGVNSQPLPGG